MAECFFQRGDRIIRVYRWKTDYRGEQRCGKDIPDESPEVVVDAAEEEAVSEIFWGLAEVS